MIVNKTVPVIVSDTKHEETPILLFARSEGEMPEVYMCKDEAEADIHMHQYARGGAIMLPKPLIRQVEVVYPVYLIKGYTTQALRKEHRVVAMEDQNTITE